MKFRIEVDADLPDDEVVLHCRELNEDMLELERQLVSLTKSSGTLSVTSGELEYFLKYSEIIFFETADNKVAVHTKKHVYFTRQKLYELEEQIPGYFVRVSKSAILNTRQIRSIKKNITGASEVEFDGSLKKAYVSRSFYKTLMEKMGN